MLKGFSKTKFSAVAFGISLTVAISPGCANAKKKFTVLHGFKGGSDGATPESPPLLDNNSGKLFGTTYDGGVGNGGTVYKLTRNGTETILHTFTGGGFDGEEPIASLISDGNGNFFGTTQQGGSQGKGSVFEIDEKGHETMLCSFPGGSNEYPSASLIIVAGTLYGTAPSNGTDGYGTVFSVSGKTQTVLYTFSGGADGREPFGGLVRDKVGNFYGTTSGGGAHGLGTVFKLTGNVESVLYSFSGNSGDGATPYAGLIIDKNGNLFGTTYNGGTNNLGSVFEVTPTGVETTIYSFKGNQDGANPYSGLLADTAGNFFGTTVNGGITGCAGQGCGTVFKIDHSGVESVIHSFTSGSGGSGPKSGLIEDANGNLYGTAFGGDNQQGVLFRIHQ